MDKNNQQNKQNNNAQNNQQNKNNQNNAQNKKKNNENFWKNGAVFLNSPTFYAFMQFIKIRI